MNSFVDISGDWTLSAWFMGLLSTNSERTLFCGTYGDPDDEIDLLPGTNEVCCYTYTRHWWDSSGVVIDQAGSSNRWQQITAVATGNVTLIYLNGAYGGACRVKSGQPIRSIGYWETDDGKHRGKKFARYLDEVRIENVGRSANWIWASYMTMASNYVFSSYGTVSVSDDVSGLISNK